jgi:hypothetical protein
VNRVTKAIVGTFVAPLLVAVAATNAYSESDVPSQGAAVDARALQTAAPSVELEPASVNNAFESLNPARILDTRPGGTTADGQFVAAGPLGPGATLDVVVVGRGGVPPLGVGAVAINVTAVASTSNGFLTVWPTGSSMPNTSNINFVAGDVVPNLAIVKVGTGGRISIFNETGATNLLVDVVGWFADNAGLQPLVPARLLDTRPGTATIDGVSAGAGAVAGDATASLVVTGRGGVPPTGASTVVLNVTVTSPTAPGFVTVWPNGDARPNASNLNFTPDQTVANLVITKVGLDGRVRLFNSSGATHLIVDVMGWFGADSELHSLLPARLLDTRPGGATIDGTFTGGSEGSPVGRNRPYELVVTGRGGVPATGVAAVALNVTVTEPLASSFLTVWPTGFVRPNASSLNYSAGKTVANMVIARVGANGSVSFYNSVLTTHLIVDVVGWLPPNAPLSLTQFNLAPGVAGQAYSSSIGATGSQAPYTFSGSDMSPGLALGAMGAMSGTPLNPGTTSTQVSVTDRFGRGGTITKPHSIFPASSNFIPVAPTTVLNSFSEPAPMPNGTMREVTVGGVAGVPMSGVAPVLSVAVLSYGPGYITLFPMGWAQPSMSQFALDTLSFVTDVEVIPLGIAGKINLYSSPMTDVRIDVIGYIPLGGSFVTIPGSRILDTRFTSPLAAGAQQDVVIAGKGGVPVGGATDVLAIVSTTETTAAGSLTIWDSGGAIPVAPAIRWPSPTSAQFVVIHLSGDGKMTVKNSSPTSSVHVLIDVYGFFA